MEKGIYMWASIVAVNKQKIGCTIDHTLLHSLPGLSGPYNSD